MSLNSDIEIRWSCGDDFKLLGIIFNVDMYNMVKKSYENALEKMNSMIKIWLKLNLTVLGRMTVVKSL